MKRLILSVLVALMLLPSMAGATSNYYTRPNGDTRFQDLSAAKRPIPSAEIDGEFNNIKSWLDGATYLWIPGTTPTYASTTTFTVVGDQTAIYVANRRIKANLTGTYVYCYVLSSSYSAPNTTVTVDSAVLTSALTSIYYGMYDVFMYGAADARNYGDGSYTAATINAALTALGTTNYRTLFIAPGTWTIDAAVTVPANITLKPVPGTVFTKSGSGSLTIAGPLDAGLYKIFDTTFYTGVTIYPDHTPFIFPNWWGASGHDTTTAADADDANGAIQAAIDCLPVTTNSSVGWVWLHGRYWSSSDEIVIAAENIGLRGDTGPYGTVIRFTSATSHGIDLGVKVSGVHIENLRLYSVNAANSTGIVKTDDEVAWHMVIQNVMIENFASALWIAPANSCTFRNIKGVGQTVTGFPKTGVGFRLGDTAHSIGQGTNIVDNVYMTSFNKAFWNDLSYGTLYIKPIAETSDYGYYISSYCTLLSPYSEGNKASADGGYDIYITSADYSFATIINPYPRTAGYARIYYNMETAGQLASQQTRIIDYKPHFVSAVLGGAQSIGVGTEDLVQFANFNTWDSFGEGVGSPTYGVQVSLPGRYEVKGQLLFSTGEAGKSYVANVYVGATKVAVFPVDSVATNSVGVRFDKTVICDAGDVITITASHGGVGAAALTTSSDSTFLQVERKD